MLDGAFIVSVLAAFGAGSLLTSFVQSWLSNRAKQKDRNFEERKQAYIGLLEAYHRAAIDGTDEAAKTFAYWQMRCDLVAPEKVRRAIAEIIETNDDKEKRYVAHERLKRELRADLGVQKST